MRRTTLFLLLATAGCVEPPRTPAPIVFADNLREIYAWDPTNGARGHPAYDAMVGSEPAESVPVLIGKLADMSATAIHDEIHDPVPVANVAFHILMRIFAMRAENFEREGVWVMRGDPSRNPIFTVKFKDDETRAKLAARFRELAIAREWVIP